MCICARELGSRPPLPEMKGRQVRDEKGNAMSLLLSLAVASALTPGWQEDLLSQSSVEPLIQARLREYRSAPVVAIAATERALTRELSLRDRGASSEEQVNLIRLSLASLQCSLASVDHKGKAARERLRARIEICKKEQERVTALFPGGAASASGMNVAQRRLANARYCLASFEKRSREIVQQLQLIVQSC